MHSNTKALALQGLFAFLRVKSTLKRYNHELSFACPSIIGQKKEYVEVLTEKLNASTGNLEPVYTHREDGRRLILNAESILISLLMKRRWERNIKFLIGIDIGPEIVGGAKQNPLS